MPPRDVLLTFRGKDPGCTLGPFKPRYRTQRKAKAPRTPERWSADQFDAPARLSKSEYAIAFVLLPGGDWEDKRRAPGKAPACHEAGETEATFLRRILPGRYWRYWVPPGEGAKVNAAAFKYNEENDITWIRSSKGRYTYYEGDGDTTADLADTFREDEKDPEDAGVRDSAKHHPSWRATHEIITTPRGRMFIGLYASVYCAIHYQFFHCCPREKAAMSDNVPLRHIWGRGKRREKMIEKRTELESDESLFRRMARTALQCQIVDLAAGGLSMADISRRLNVTTKTIERQIKKMTDQTREPLQEERARLAARIAEIDKTLESGIPSFFRLLDDADKAHAIASQILGHYGEPTEEDRRVFLAGLKVAAENPGKEISFGENGEIKVEGS